MGNVFSSCVLAEISEDFLQHDCKLELGEIVMVDCLCRSNSSYSAAVFMGQALGLQEEHVAWGLQRKLRFTGMPSGASAEVGTMARPGLGFIEDVYGVQELTELIH